MIYCPQFCLSAKEAWRRAEVSFGSVTIEKAI
jgi:hypothetical protein